MNDLSTLERAIRNEAIERARTDLNNRGIAVIRAAQCGTGALRLDDVLEYAAALHRGQHHLSTNARAAELVYKRAKDFEQQIADRVLQNAISDDED